MLRVTVIRMKSQKAINIASEYPLDIVKNCEFFIFLKIKSVDFII